MTGTPTFTVRPLSKQPRPDQKDSFRICLSSTSLLYLKLRPGDTCSLETIGGEKKAAIAWSAPERIQDTVVQTSRTLQEIYGFRLGEKISIYKESDLEDIYIVRLEECTDPAKLATLAELSDADRAHWEWGMEYPLSKCEILAAGMVFELDLKGCRRSFRISSIEAEGSSAARFTISRFTTSSRVRIGNYVEPEGPPPVLAVTPVGVGGLGRQLSQINEKLQDFGFLKQRVSMPSFYRASGGILIWGPKGTGKSLLLSKLGTAGWRKVFTVDSTVMRKSSGEGEALLRKTFLEATQCQPSIILIDQVDFIAPKRGSSDAFSIGPLLCEVLDHIQNSRVLVVACTRHPNDVDDALRTPRRLGIEIEISVPTAKEREEILLAIRGSDMEPSSELIGWIAERTHGYVGADLFALLQQCCRKANIRQSQELPQTMSMEASSSQDHHEIALHITEEDILLALQETQATAMREVFLETPKVKWNDIGGQHDVKKRLRKAVERPLKLYDRMKKLNISGKKGVLLYGPPGCSKTLLVKALATEAGLNFLAVKGAEILSMYVGESERALREIFRKARAASPSIIFFDEIDAIASRRGDPGSHSGVNVLTTLLNEMDGVEELKNVLVVAATNKPEVLDPALMRPGRLDNILYIGPPDLQAREEIFTIWCNKSEIADDVDVGRLAAATEGYSGAELISICETAAGAALDDEEETGVLQRVAWKHFEYALDQVPKQISPAVVEGYDRWRNSFR
ncbi:hypothetical protein AJ80_09390 [Polytolypa hystricis UAMH7299]|uniref:AAA+ ATPase domain-containing protein n=1 Tax=Polytolypa hystricis (strain UAMH7299) TaxID=1447883 RepID=A0A2B7WS19_POLH7|nr:hypothetical protein AJ80_09390 [Polytolypa hystricis UAMH7299]